MKTATAPTKTSAPAKTPAKTVALAPVADPKKNSTNAILISDNALAFFNALKNEFKGPGATKETPLTSVEAFDLLLSVASDRRFGAHQKHDDETGEALFDTDGQPEMVHVDLFEKEAEKIFKNRGNTSNKSKIEKLKAKMAALGVDVSKL